ncbi:MAG: hypothetical protein ACOZE7_00055 [Pseudomonadota bacterium]
MALHVISDLHIGSGVLDDCDAGCEAGLIGFIDELTAGPSPVELVLNGDSFDFVQAEPWRVAGLEATAVDGSPLCFTRETSLAKAESIIKAHPLIFDALTRFVRREGARLTIMPGNHDADLYWPEVRELMGRRIHGQNTSHRARVNWYLDRVYRPARAPHVWIEHGHQHDPLNNFYAGTLEPLTEYWGAMNPPILRAKDGTDRLLECIGTRFLIRFLNELDARYHFVDNIKPLSRFLGIFASSANNLSGGTARAALSALAFFRFAGVEGIVAPSNLLSLGAQGEGLGAALRAIDEASDGAFSMALEDAGCDFGGRSFTMATEDTDAAIGILDHALAHLDTLDGVALDTDSILGVDDEDDGMLSLAKGLKLDETQILKDAATLALKTPGVTHVIMGHTHEPVDEPHYKNIGSWTRYWQMTPGTSPSWAEMVARAPSLPMSLRHAVVHDDPAQGVTLQTYTPAA